MLKNSQYVVSSMELRLLDVSSPRWLYHREVQIFLEGSDVSLEATSFLIRYRKEIDRCSGDLLNLVLCTSYEIEKKVCVRKPFILISLRWESSSTEEL